jgi:hypothetical protein
MTFIDMSEQDFNRIVACAHTYEILKEGRDMARRGINFLRQSGINSWPHLELLCSSCREGADIRPDGLFLDDLAMALENLKARYEAEISRLVLEIGAKITPLPLGTGESTD